MVNLKGHIKNKEKTKKKKNQNITPSAIGSSQSNSGWKQSPSINRKEEREEEEKNPHNMSSLVHKASF